MDVICPFYHSNKYVVPPGRWSTSIWVPGGSCPGCGDPIALEMESVFMELKADIWTVHMTLHKKCGELPREIHHPRHPNHPLCLMYFLSSVSRCDLCGLRLHELLGYQCRSCNFNIGIRCEKIGIDAFSEERRELQHPSHPSHPLTVMRKPPFLFKCDGCGDEDVDMACICTTCEFWVHKSCALSPTILECGRHRHHHPLSLAFSFPEKHRKYSYKCEVCDKHIGRANWVYFCGDCRYFVHIKCVVGSTTIYSNLNKGDDEDVIEFPLHANDIFSKLMVPFVMGQTGVVTTSTSSTDGNSSFSLKNYHEHPLSLVSEFTNEEEELLRICDVCITPISNSTPYYQCATCTYSIHSLLPNTLHHSSSSSSNVSHLFELYFGCRYKPNKTHKFKLLELKGSDAISRWWCGFCNLSTNGMGYECEDCGKKIDVKCASLPTKIRHLSHHPRHHKPLILTSDNEGKTCHCCNSSIYVAGYCCSHDGCDFALDLKCALLPSRVTNREWDKHPLLLTFDASLDHPSDFFCEFCETEMYPKEWMYHCRECDASFHPDCLMTGSGYYRNMKLGGRYDLDKIHPHHPLTYTCVALKKHCDVCHKKMFVYTYVGFECASCYYVVCEGCGVKELDRKKKLKESLC